jgi:hypothetical protein
MPPSAPTFAIRPNLTLFELRGKHAVRARRASRRARLVAHRQRQVVAVERRVVEGVELNLVVPSELFAASVPRRVTFKYRVEVGDVCDARRWRAVRPHPSRP